nr:hypothetical protein [Tanacetum cinerariifolium]
MYALQVKRSKPLKYVLNHQPMGFSRIPNMALLSYEVWGVILRCRVAGRNPRGYIKLSKIQVGLKPCKKSFFNSRCRNFRLTEGKSASTPIDTEKPLLKDPDGEDVDVHTYRSMIGSLMYLTSSRPDNMFADDDVTRLQALVDKKKVVIIEAAIKEKVFANIRRVGKGFSGVETPLFKGMIVEQVIEEGGADEEHVEDDTDAQGDDTTAQGDDAQEPFMPSPTPPTPPLQPPQDLPSTS